MCKTYLYLFLAVSSAVNVAAASAVFPIRTIYEPSGIPLAVVIGMESKPKKFVALQLDTGSPMSIVYGSPSYPDTLDEKLMQLSTKLEEPQFLGDSGKRALVRLSGEHENFDALAAVVNLGRASGGVVGVLGVDWFNGKAIDIKFDSNLLLIGSERGYNNKLTTSTSTSTALYFRKNRLEISVCFPLCQDLIFDTGIAISDIVEFVSLEELTNTVADDGLIEFPGVLGPVRCRRPIKSSDTVSIGQESFVGLYFTTCAFVESPRVVLNRKALGIRSIVENKGRIILNMKEERIELDFGKLKLH